MPVNTNSYDESYKLAITASRDAGERSARTNNRTVWNETDWYACANVFDKIMDVLNSQQEINQ